MSRDRGAEGHAFVAGGWDVMARFQMGSRDRGLEGHAFIAGSPRRFSFFDLSFILE